MRAHTASRVRQPLGERVRRGLGSASKFVPVLGVAALAVAILAALAGGSPVSAAEIPDRVLRIVLFVLSCFIGSYLPVPGMPDEPSPLAALALVLALLTSLGGVALAVLSVFSRELGLALATVRRGRSVVLGDGPGAQIFAERLREVTRTVVTVGEDDRAMIRVSEWADATDDSRVRRALRGATAAYALYESSVDGAITAGAIRELGGTTRIYQMFDWKLDRLVFREPIRGGTFPPHEVFSPEELTAIHLAGLIGHLVRVRRRTLRVHLRGGHHALEILHERLSDMQGVLRFRGGVEFADTAAEADVAVLGVERHEYIAAVDEVIGDERTVFAIAPERYFRAVGRGDLGVVSSAHWLAGRDPQGDVPWRRQVILVDDAVVGWDPAEVSLGIRGRWAREFHNAHSDFTVRDRPDAGSPNRWLDSPPHPRLHTMALAAVDLMLRDLDAFGYDLIVRTGPHDVLSEDEVETCARHIHDQYLTLTWQDEDKVSHRCSDHWVDAHGNLQQADSPASWEDDTEEGRARNRAMVREVYPALAAIFGYRITRVRRAV